MTRSLSCLAGIAAVICVAQTREALAQVGASGNAGNGSQTTVHNSMGFGGNTHFEITENVTLDPSAGHWLKELVNVSGQGIASGNNVQLIEVLTNTGTIPWTDWHERVISRTTLNNPDDAPGYLFRSGSLSLSADYGAGFVPLVEGVDYTVSPTFYSGPPDPGNNFDWEMIDIFFSPLATILPGDVLRIEKQIFEVFGDANIWRPDDVAIIAQYPTPEPASLSLCAFAVVFLARRRNSR